MLELRPNCERCDADLPPAADARICTYECTFCPDCAENHLQNVCPNCGGGFVPRPIRPVAAYREGSPPHPRRATGRSTSTVILKARIIEVFSRKLNRDR